MEEKKRLSKEELRDIVLEPEDLKKVRKVMADHNLDGDPSDPDAGELKVFITTLKAIGWAVAGAICFGVSVKAIEELEKLGQVRVPDVKVQTKKAPANKAPVKKAPVKTPVEKKETK